MKNVSMTAGLLSALLWLSVFGACSLPNGPRDEEAVMAGETGWGTQTSPVTLRWYVEGSVPDLRWGEGAITRAITEETGVSVRLLMEYEDGSRMLDRLAASGSMPDLVTLEHDSPSVNRLFSGNALYPLGELAATYGSVFFAEANAAVAEWHTMADGNLYWYPSGAFTPEDYDEIDVPALAAFAVREDMYNSIGRPDMTGPEGFLAALREARETFPQMGGAVLIPFGCAPFTELGCVTFGDALQDFLAVPREGDRFTHPEYIRWLKALRQAGEEGLLHPEIFTDKAVQVEEKIVQGRYFSILCPLEDMRAGHQRRYAALPDAAYLAVEGPGGGNSLPGQGMEGRYLTMIPRGADEPGRAILFMEYLISRHGQHMSVFGTDEEKSWQKAANPGLELVESARRPWMLEDTALLIRWGVYPDQATERITGLYAGRTAPAIAGDGRPVLRKREETAVEDAAAALWGETLPRLLLAPTEDEFDRLWENWLSGRENLGWRVEFSQ